MEKKAKKRVEVLQQRLQKLRQQLAGARKQLDEPDEVRALEREVAQIAEELERLKSTP
jgi:hypothetical protein